ncbi:hypothetical protein FB451DRAFT_1172075 [Mycena latifolia]|nr:hypothetical protein FB451DRAFT_1172075 [Mycena latifolia]
MSTHTRPDSAMATLTKATRIYMACVNCRAGKVKVGFYAAPCISSGDGQPCARCTKKRLECEYLAVPNEQARSGTTSDSGRRSRRQPPAPSAPASHMSAGWTQAPHGYQASPRGSQPQPNPGFGPPQTASQCNPSPSVSAPIIQPNRYPPQPHHFAGGDNIPYNYGGTAPQPPTPQLAHPSSRQLNQQPGFAAVSLAVHATVVQPDDERVQMT